MVASFAVRADPLTDITEATAGRLSAPTLVINVMADLTIP